MESKNIAEVSGSEINLFLREPTGGKPKNFGRQMEGLGCQRQVVAIFCFFFCLPRHDREENNPSGTQDTICLNL